MITKHHLKWNIDGMLRNYGKKSMDGFIEDDGVPIGNKECRALLKEWKAKGYKYVPIDNCEGFDPYEKGCPGHLVHTCEEKKDSLT